ncbi:MBL fold metallo-hydrolase [Neobacillus vireti]|uniref:MBL fold metallo-hydrolase n=1 Tax=Neobacillus vireti TaxID=220686 RepID=UPI002FFFA486
MEPLVYFRSEKISDRVTRIFGPAGEIMYLVEGSERAALIDTGTGVGDLRTLIERLTDKPYFVLLTHGHVDHAMGAPAFEEVYMNPADQEVYASHSDYNVRKGFLEMSMGENFARVKEEDYIPIGSSDRYKPLLPGDMFDLGGIHLEVNIGAGHTPGLVTILLVEERTLLLGDACNFFTFLFDEFSLGITSYENMLRELDEKTAGGYDKVYLSHGDGDAPKEMIESVIALCEDIKAGRTDDVPFDFMEHKAFIAKAIDQKMNRLDGGLGNIVYNKEKIHL